MIRFLRVLWLTILLPVAAMAQTVQVTTGEHDGFTRLVLDYGAVRDWQVGRTLDGYEIRLVDATPVYDLTGVYDPIGRGRLASVWADPQTGALRIGIGCACHAQPFEFRPGIVVIDLKDGPPPQGSVFELALTGQPLPDLAPRPAPRPRARPQQAARALAGVDGPVSYDWTAARLGPVPQVPSPPMTDATAILPTADPGLQPLRAILLQQLSRGAAEGVVEMAEPQRHGPTVPQTDPVQVRLNDLPGVRIAKVETAPAGLTATGATCVADDRLDIGTWGTDAPVSEQMADAMAGLIGEFDAPDPQAELRAVRFLLFIGFGSEARQTLKQISTLQPDAEVLTSLGHIIDNTRDPAPAFAGMTACDTAAALWAVLGDPAPKRGTAFDRAAVLRTFSALPVHLRRLVGPPLVDRLLALDDNAAAQTVRDAILRAPGDAGPEVALMEARLDLDQGDPESADARLEPLIATSGPATPDALIAQVATHLARRAPLDKEQITALEALLHERRGGPEAERFAVALTQARALGGEFDQAFADLAEVPQASSAVWSLLAETGPDSAVLAHAIRAAGTTPSVAAPTAALLARRLSDLGFAAQARDWLQQVPAADPDLAARIALQTRDARAALRLVSGSADPALQPLRINALRQLADDAALAQTFANSGDEDARWRAVGRARDWPQLADAGPAPWKTLAAAAIGQQAETPPDPAVTGPLAQGQALLDQSSQTRQTVQQLLALVAGPTRATP